MSNKGKAQKKMEKTLRKMQEMKKKFLIEQFQKDLQVAILNANIELLETLFQATYQEDSKAGELIESMLSEFKKKLREI